MKQQNRFGFEHLETRNLLTAVAEFVADIRPGQLGGFNGLEQLFVFNDEIFFSANDGNIGSELWKSDGTEAGTTLVKDIHRGGPDDSSHPGWFAELNGELYFSAVDSSSGDELWKTDGTTQGTVRVADILPGEDGSRPVDLFTLGDSIVFSASLDDNGSELWTSDGTSSGTELVADIREGERSSSPGNYSGFYEFKGKVYFNAEANETGVELWRSDLTPDGTELVIDAARDGDSWPTNFFEYNDQLFFTAEVHNDEFDSYFSHLFRVNPETGQGEQVIEMPIQLDEGVIVSGDWMYFAGLDGDVGWEMFRSDGTEAGTTLTRNIMPGDLDAHPRNFYAHDGKVYFAAGDERDPETLRNIYSLWVTDGTAFGTRKVSPEQINPLNPFVEHGGDIYYSARSGELGWELFRTNGILPSEVVHDVNPGTADSFAIPKKSFDGQMLFIAEDPTNGWEIWSDDGESVELVEVHLGGGDFTPEPTAFQFLEYGNDLIFLGSNPFDGLELHRIRSTSQPVRLAGDANEDEVVDFSDFLALSGNFGRENADWAMGDFNGDTVVDFSDFLILSGNFGATTEPVAAAADDTQTAAYFAAAFGDEDEADNVAAIDEVYGSMEAGDLSAEIV